MKRYAALILLICAPFWVTPHKTSRVSVRQSQIGALNAAIAHTHNKVSQIEQKLDAYQSELSAQEQEPAELYITATPIMAVDIPYTIDQPGLYQLMEPVILEANQPGIIIVSDNVSLDLQGLSISGADQPGTNSAIQIMNVKDVKIKNGTIQKIDGSGIDISNSSHITLDSLLSSANHDHGYKLSAGSSWQIINCYAADNKGYGFFVQGGSVVQFEHAYATNNILDGFNVAATHTKYNNCLAVENTGSGFAHLGNNLSVSVCQAHANGMNGFICATSANIHINDYKAHLNTFAGLSLSSSSEFRVANALCMNNSTHGITLDGCQNGSLLSTACQKNQQHGIYSITTDSVAIMQSEMSNNLSDGINIGNGLYWTVKQNEIHYNGGSGMQFMGNQSVIKGNSVTHNAIGIIDKYGVDIGLNATTNELFANQCKHNGVSPGLPVATDTNYSAGVYQSPVSSPIGSQVSPGGGIGALENITTT